MSPKLKHQGGAGPCVLCGAVTACEWLDGEDRWTACPDCALVLHEHPERRPAPSSRSASPQLPRPALTLAERRHAVAVEELTAELAAEFPDRVDTFEDDLARKLGLRRHPSMPLGEWRRLRVRFIEEWT